MLLLFLLSPHDCNIHCALRHGGGRPMNEPFVFRAADAERLRASLHFQTMESENPLPEDRRRMIEKWFETLQGPNYDCIFDDELPPESEYRCKLTPLDTVPLLTVSTEAGITQKDVDKAPARERERPCRPRTTSAASCAPNWCAI